jgi:hypothetical protein
MSTCLYAFAVAVLQEKFAQIFSYASQHATDVEGGPDFMDDAIRIERCAQTHCSSSRGFLDSSQQLAAAGALRLARSSWQQQGRYG